MSDREVTEQHRAELELFAEHAARLAESIGVRSRVGFTIATIAHSLDMALAEVGER
jgi:hypothetical protein